MIQDTKYATTYTNDGESILKNIVVKQMFEWVRNFEEKRLKIYKKENKKILI